MLGKQLFSLLAVALPQLGRALPLDAGVDRSLEQPPTSCEPRNITCPSYGQIPSIGRCYGNRYFCAPRGFELYISAAVGGCVECQLGYWIPWREWTHDEIMDYFLGKGVPPP